MNSTNHEASNEGFTADPPVSVLNALTVRALEPQEYSRAGEVDDRLGRAKHLSALIFADRIAGGSPEQPSASARVRNLRTNA